jgi:hypothetical protein
MYTSPYCGEGTQHGVINMDNKHQHTYKAGTKQWQLMTFDALASR